MVEEHKRCLDGSGLWWRKGIRIGGAAFPACSTPESTRILYSSRGWAPPRFVDPHRRLPPLPLPPHFSAIFSTVNFIYKGSEVDTRPPLYNRVTPLCDSIFLLTLPSPPPLLPPIQQPRGGITLFPGSLFPFNGIYAVFRGFYYLKGNGGIWRSLKASGCTGQTNEFWMGWKIL